MDVSVPVPVPVATGGSGKKVFIWTTIALLFIGAGVFVWWKYFRNKATADAKANRNIRFVRTDDSNFSGKSRLVVSSNASGDFDVGNDTLIQVPTLSSSDYSAAEAAAIKVKMDTIDTKYGSYINNIAALTKVSAEIIKSFIYVESSGDPNVTSSTGCCFGLMQISPDTASQVISDEFNSGRLSAEEAGIILKYLPNASIGSKPTVTSADLFKPEFNILVGAIFLGQLIDNETYDQVVSVNDDGSFASLNTDNTVPDTDATPMVATKKMVRMDYVIARYNRGAYIWLYGGKPSGNPDDVCDATGACTYIKRVLGVNGTLDILVS